LPRVRPVLRPHSGRLCEKEAPRKTFFSVRHTFFDAGFCRFRPSKAIDAACELWGPAGARRIRTACADDTKLHRAPYALRKSPLLSTGCRPIRGIRPKFSSHLRQMHLECRSISIQICIAFEAYSRHVLIKQAIVLTGKFRERSRRL
jgi:hypothetical protein